MRGVIAVAVADNTKQLKLKKMNKQIALGAGAILVIIALAWIGTRGEDDAVMTADEVVMTDRAASAPDAMMAVEPTPENNAMMAGDDAAMSPAGTYEAYAPEKVAALAAAGKKVVLFFHAPWCPTCKALDADLVANAAAIPANVAILKTDYDSETALKQRYGVTYQHILVQLNAAGDQVAKWDGSRTLPALLHQVK